MTKEELKALTGLIAGLTGIATAVASCNQAAQERLKADNKIYSTLAEGQKQQAADISEIHKQLDEMRTYLGAVRSAEPTMPLPLVTPLRPPLTRVPRFLSAPPSPEPTELPELPSLPSAAPAPILRPLPKFDDLVATP